MQIVCRMCVVKQPRGCYNLLQGGTLVDCGRLEMEKGSNSDSSGTFNGLNPDSFPSRQHHCGP